MGSPVDYLDMVIQNGSFCEAIERFYIEEQEAKLFEYYKMYVDSCSRSGNKANTYEAWKRKNVKVDMEKAIKNRKSEIMEKDEVQKAIDNANSILSKFTPPKTG